MNELKMNFSRSAPSIKLADCFVFMIPLLGLLKFSIIGELFVHEIVLVGAVPYFLVTRSDGKNKALVAIVLVMVGLWFFSQVLTDLIRDTAFEDYSRGWAKIIFFGSAFYALSRIVNTPVRAFLWIGASSIAVFFRSFQLFEDQDWVILWKFGIGPALLTAAILPSLWRLLKNPDDCSLYRRIAFLHFTFGVFSFFLNARSFAGLAILTGFFVWFYPMYKGRRIAASGIVISLGLFLLLAVSLVNVYSLGASSGFFGEEARSKYETQVMYGNSTFDILIGGRSESLVSTIAISDSPFIGHGSWAKDYRYAALYLELRARFSEVAPDMLYRDSMKDGLIPSHSYLLGAWVEAGVLGALFWVVVVWISFFKVIPAAVERSDVIGLLALLLLPVFLWNIFFSPFGANVRVEAAGVMTILVLSVSLPFRKIR